MNNPNAVYVYIVCGISYIFILFFILALCKSSAIADEKMEEYKKELEKNLDHEN